DATKKTATSVVRDAVAAAAEAAPELPPDSEILRGATIPTLQDVSKHAALLVLGSRGLSGFTGLLAGSVTVALAARGHSPVVVVRGDEVSSDGPVVGGVDGSPASQPPIALPLH